MGSCLTRITFGTMSGSGCSTMVEHMPAEQNSRGIGIESHQVMGLLSFLLYPISSASLVQVPNGGATLLIFTFKKYA